jgi:hypothetical protein
LIARMTRVAAVIAILAATGCMRWDVVTADPRSFVETEQPSLIRVTLADQSRVEIREPIVAGDSIASHQDCERAVTPDGRVHCTAGTGGVTVERIESLEVRRVDAGSSITGVSLVLLALIAVANAAAPF